MSISSRLEAINQHLLDDYSILTLAGADLTNVDKNIENLKQSWEERLLYFLANGTDVVWNNWLPKVNGSGETITLNNTIEAKMDFVYKGNTSQYSTTGKNLLDINNLTTNNATQQISGSTLTLTGTGAWARVQKTLTLKANTSYTLMGWVKGTNGYNAGLLVTDSSQSYQPIKFNSLGQRVYLTLNFDTSVSTELTIQLYGNWSSTTANTTTVFEKVMLVEGTYTTEQDYEEYTGNQPSPSPDYPQDIQVVSGDNTIKVEGKNLANLSSLATETSNGITLTPVFEDNKLQYININGTSTALTVFSLTTYTTTTNNVLNGCFGGSSSTYKLDFWTSGYVYANFNNEDTQLPNNSLGTLRIVVYSGKTVNNVKIYPMISTSGGEYQPYQSASYEIDLRTSENLFDISTIIRGYELNSNTGGIQVNANWWLSDYIGIKQNTDYTSSNISSLTKCWYDSNKNFISKVQATTGTSPANARYLRVNGTLASIESNPNLMIEEGDTATTYEPYNSIELCKIGDYQDKIAKSTGKNLFAYGTTAIDKTATYRTNQYQRLLLTATANPNEVKFNYNGNYCMGYIEMNGIDGTLPYKISFSIKENTTNYTPSVAVDTTNSTNQKLVFIVYGNNRGTTVSSSNYFILTNIQVESGSTITPYEPYGKVWYLNKQIGKVVYTGSESGSWTPSTFGGFTRFAGPIISDTLQTARRHEMKSNYFHYLSSGGEVGAGFIYAGQFFAYPNQTITTEQDFRDWLSSHNTTVYYPLATPTTTEITDTTLISQLEAIKKSYNNQTNISQTNADKPFILDVVALGELEI